ncbi:sensor histidine kinase [Sphingobacterium bambusae]|uniref:histidine kinase n=1 Tax=Sphingobacterium bambusae TaxID=662858 RepID=A0ABW6BC81_9SPHI|nr:HAMP domain-containing sensor histidine kinase [Sphingobacterium bambusae]WPL48357.1 HAMP domain-containing sensor histidine kinase [Sphingobacterium bambusae]
MKENQVIYLLLGAVLLSKVIIGFLIVHLLRRKRELKKERTKLCASNEQLEDHIAKIEEQQKELLAAENFKLKILSLASHDLRTPFQELSMLLEYVDVLQLDEASLKEVTSSVKGQVGVSKALLDNVLVWTAGQLRGNEYTKVTFSLKEQVDQAISLFATQSKKKGLHIEQHIDSSQAIQGNVDIFNFVLRNLLSNAIKYSDIGGTVEIGLLGDKEGMLRFFVRDFGSGMDVAVLQRLQKGELMESKKGTENEKGMGLGLSLCQDLIARVGWSMDIRREERGSCFSLLLPLEDAKEAPKTGNELFYRNN